MSYLLLVVDCTRIKCATIHTRTVFRPTQSTVETATFGSEYVAARTCTEQIIDLQTTLRYLGYVCKYTSCYAISMVPNTVQTRGIVR